MASRAAERFSVENLYQRSAFEPGAWLNFHPDFADAGDDPLARATLRLFRPGDVIFVDPEGRRRIEFVDAPLRLLPSQWAYDQETRTLFTVDMFSWARRPSGAGSWVCVDGDADSSSAETVEHHLTRNRYWWLPGARTDSIRRALAAASNDIWVSSVPMFHSAMPWVSSAKAMRYRESTRPARNPKMRPT